MGTDADNVIRDHRRQWRRCLYVYPVISRRAGGLSIGVNLNPDKRCTFGCLYCQIDRTVSRGLTAVDFDVLRGELDLALVEAATGSIWQEPRFAQTPPELRRIHDVAFSGDGEPTCLAGFDQAVRVAADAKADAGLDDVRIVVITNASRLTSPQVHRALPTLETANGEFWAKLDAGTEARFRRINRPAAGVTLADVVAGIASVARELPVVIQSLFFRLDGEGPPAEEIAAYCRRLEDILRAGGRIRLVQIHTIARPPADAAASMLPDDELDAVADTVRAALPDLPVETYYGQDVEPQHRGGDR